MSTRARVAVGTHLPRLRWAVLASLLLALNACAQDGGAPGDATGTAPASPARPASPASPASPQESSAPSARDTGDGMDLALTIGGERMTATLDDSAAARDLLDQLPVTVEMSDHGGVEKTGRLPRPLSLAGQPDGADPDVGDLGYYAPGNDLVLYHGDQSYFPGIVVLGRLGAGAAERIAGMTGPVSVRVEAGDAHGAR